jgi:hypothetical protein
VTSLLNDSSHPLYEIRDKLGKYINKIDDYYDIVIAKHDRDFLNAYKMDMNKYKKQLTQLKQQAEDAAGALLRDDKVSNLHNQITWFKNEAVLLDEVVDKLSREIQKYEIRDHRLVEDRKFLKD